jgi:hypothetical protein
LPDIESRGPEHVFHVVRQPARLASLRKFDDVSFRRDSMRGGWRPRWFDGSEALWKGIRFALRALLRVKALHTDVNVSEGQDGLPRAGRLTT